MKEIGSVQEFSNGNFELIENVIVPEKEKKSFLIKLNLYTLLFMVIFLGVSIGIYLLIHDIILIGFGLLGPILFLFSSLNFK